MFFAFDLLHLDGVALTGLPLLERKRRLAELLGGNSGWLHYVDHQEGDGRAFHRAACRAGLEGIVSKPANLAYLPGDRRAWVKVKCLNREEFVVVGWTDPEGPAAADRGAAARLLRPDGCLLYAGRAGGGIADNELERLWHRLQPLAVDRMPLAAPPPRTSRFGRPRAVARTLGATRAGRPGDLPDLDQRRTIAPGRLSGRARGQAGPGGCAHASAVMKRGLCQSLRRSSRLLPIDRRVTANLASTMTARRTVHRHLCRVLCHCLPGSFLLLRGQKIKVELCRFNRFVS